MHTTRFSGKQEIIQHLAAAGAHTHSLFYNLNNSASSSFSHAIGASETTRDLYQDVFQAVADPAFDIQKITLRDITTIKPIYRKTGGQHVEIGKTALLNSLLRIQDQAPQNDLKATIAQNKAFDTLKDAVTFAVKTLQKGTEQQIQSFLNMLFEPITRQAA